MNLLSPTCLTCRAIRRTLFAFILGAIVAWQASGYMPLHGVNETMATGLMLVVVLFAFLNVFMRMREMRARFRRRG